MTNITAARKVTYFSVPALVWEVRERGAASVRTRYTQWVEDGQHWAFEEPKMVGDVEFTGGGWVSHKAGETWARTVRGNFNGRTGKVLVDNHQLPADAATDVIYY